MILSLLATAVCVAFVRAQPPATVLETRLPHIGGVQPSCSPAITADGVAYACYKTMSKYFVAAMRPSGTAMLLNNATAPYTTQPQLANGVAVVYESLRVGSFYATATPTQCVEYYDRHGIGAAVGLIGNTLAVPLGGAAKEGYEDYVQLLSVDNFGVTTLLNNIQLNNSDPTGTAVVGPVVWNSKFVMMVGQTLYLLSPSGVILRQTTNPCGLTFQSVQGIAVIDYQMSGSAVSMLVLYGNTTVTQESFHFCSMNPFTLTANWNLQYNDTLDVDDVIGNAGVLLVSATVITARVLVTFSIDAAAGQHVKVLTRHAADLFAWPVFLPNGISGCTATFVMQSEGRATAFCSDTFAALWSVPFRCSHQAAIDVGRNRLVCTDWGAGVTMLDFDGTVMWHDERIKAEFQPTLQNERVYAMDGAATLWILSYSPGSAIAPPASAGLTGGEVFLIIFGILLISGCIVGAAVYYKRAARRASKPIRIDAEGYGSLTT